MDLPRRVQRVEAARQLREEQRKGKEDLDTLGGDVAKVKDDVAASKAAIEAAQAQLQRAIGDLGEQSGLIARNADELNALKRAGHAPDADELEELRQKVKSSYDEQTDVRYAAARLWVDKIIEPAQTRDALLLALSLATQHDEGRVFKTGVLQV